ncbi:hypothetical protein FB451DRAFT_1187648 [Mycena latifolia]|nr:hypothetical protein FB451DRAFT_1187648 [Mycena latifolia]
MSPPARGAGRGVGVGRSERGRREAKSEAHADEEKMRRERSTFARIRTAQATRELRAVVSRVAFVSLSPSGMGASVRCAAARAMSGLREGKSKNQSEFPNSSEDGVEHGIYAHSRQWAKDKRQKTKRGSGSVRTALSRSPVSVVTVVFLLPRMPMESAREKTEKKTGRGEAKGPYNRISQLGGSTSSTMAGSAVIVDEWRQETACSTSHFRAKPSEAHGNSRGNETSLTRPPKKDKRQTRLQTETLPLYEILWKSLPKFNDKPCGNMFTAIKPSAGFESAWLLFDRFNDFC